MKPEQHRIRFVVVLSMTLLSVVFILPSVLRAEVIFIVNKSVPLDTLNKTEIKRIFLGDNPVWPDGEEITLATQEKTDIQKEFAKKYTQKSEAQYTNYWRRMMFTGKGMIPKSFSSDKAVMDFVSNTKGAIGYISSKAALNRVKPITVIDN